ncbi:MAG: NmrA family NAD(P)-binding protein [Rubrobacteraceae bacterium]|nr:NmrA family NAD(P)-binding protein [Rubrobacteraceae bacterium]
MESAGNGGPLILVSGATGNQGGAVARRLLKRDFRVRALSRDTQKPEAQALAEGGAEVVRGDLNDRSSVDRALEGAYGVFFMQNWEMMRDQILDGTLAQPLDPEKPLQQVNVEDIGAFTAIAFENPDEWLGREVDLAGDELTMLEVAETMSQVTGREISYYQVPWNQFREQMGEEFAVMYEWFNEVGYEADIPALRSEYPELTTLEQYLRNHGWEGT